MHTIAEIRVDTHQKNYYYVDIGGENFPLTTLHIHEDILVKHGLRKDLEITADELSLIRSEEEDNKSYLSAIYYLSYRMRSVQEMETYLLKKGFSRRQIYRTIKRLKIEKLLDDGQFADAFVRTRVHLSTKGPERIYRELLGAGVDPSAARSSLEAYPLEDQLANAVKFLNKKKAALKGKHSPAEGANKIRQMLRQRGFSSQVIEQALSGCSVFTAADEEQALAYQGEKAAQKYKKYTGRAFEQKVKSCLYRKGFSLQAIDVFLRERPEESDEV